MAVQGNNPYAFPLPDRKQGEVAFARFFLEFQALENILFSPRGDTAERAFTVNVKVEEQLRQGKGGVQALGKQGGPAVYGLIHQR